MELDLTAPPFSKENVPSETLLVYLDRARPLFEPKWVKSGEWLKSMSGWMFWFTRDAAGSWERKIEVVDPDPVSFCQCPCFITSKKQGRLTKPCTGPLDRTVLDGWAANSTVGLQTGRQRFVRTHIEKQITFSKFSFVLCVENVLPPSRKQYLQFRHQAFLTPFSPPCLPAQLTVHSRPTYLLLSLPCGV